MRTWINDTRNYMTPVKIGAVMRAGGIGRVVQSKADTHSPGDLVSPSSSGPQWSPSSHAGAWWEARRRRADWRRWWGPLDGKSFG